MLYFKFSLFALLFLIQVPIHAQLIGTTHYNTVNFIADNTTDESNFVYFGPQSILYIQGSLTLHAEQVWIHPQAIFRGTGKLILSSHSYMPNYTTLIDHNNGMPFEIDIVIRNPFGIRLTDLLDPEYNTPHIPSPYSARLNTIANIEFEPNAGPIYLHNSDLALLHHSSQLINSGGNRYVISGNTNLGHLIKRNASFEPFTFPLGISANSYTPATLEFKGLAAANVVNYQVSGLAIQAPSEGIDRTWHIYGELDSSGALRLQHQQATEGALYVDQNAFITQYLGQQSWSSANSIHFIQNQQHQYGNFEFSSEAQAPASWFSKTSDFHTPLPVTLSKYELYCIDSRAELHWRTESEFNSQQFRIEGSTDLIDWVELGEIESLGSTDNTHDYSYRLPHLVMEYVRLIQLDYDGTATPYMPLHNICSSPLHKKFYVYPNPSKGLTKLVYHSMEDRHMELLLFNSIGKMVVKRELIVYAGQNETVLDLEEFGSGAYTLLLQDNRSNNKQHTLKVVLH